MRLQNRGLAQKIVYPLEYVLWKYILKLMMKKKKRERGKKKERKRKREKMLGCF